MTTVIVDAFLNSPALFEVDKRLISWLRNFLFSGQESLGCTGDDINIVPNISEIAQIFGHHGKHYVKFLIL